MRDPYETLGLSRSATQGEVKSAFRNLARQYHPDTSPNTPNAREKFTAIRDAYSILGDATARATYDAHGHVNTPIFTAGFSQHIVSERNTPIDEFEFADFAPKAANARQTPQFDAKIPVQRLERRKTPRNSNTSATSTPQSPDLYVRIPIPLRDIALGVNKRIALPNGKIAHFDVPKGAAHGHVVTIKGHGNPIDDKRTLCADAHITIEHASDTPFRLEGTKAYLDLPIALHEALLGATIRIPTFYGPVDLAVPPASTGREILRVPVKGWPVYNQSTGTLNIGDLFVALRIILPENNVQLLHIAQSLQMAHNASPRGAEFHK